MNKSLNECLDFSFELNIELNDFLALFNVWMNNQNLSPRANFHWLPQTATDFHWLSTDF